MSDHLELFFAVPIGGGGRDSVGHKRCRLRSRFADAVFCTLGCHVGVCDGIRDDTR